MFVLRPGLVVDRIEVAAVRLELSDKGNLGGGLGRGSLPLFEDQNILTSEGFMFKVVLC